MHFSDAFLVAASLALTATAVPKAPRAHEKREFTHSAWRLVGRAAPKALVPVRIGLKQSNLDEGARLFDDMTDFHSPNYGKWWTPEDISDFFAPSEHHVELVHAWLTGAGVDAGRISRSSNKQWIQFDAPLVELETLLSTQYHEYEHQDGRIVPACGEYHIPSHLSQVVDYITPGINLGRSSVHKARGKIAEYTSRQPLNEDLPPLSPAYHKRVAAIADTFEGCAITAVTPACIMAMYNITPGTTATPGNELGLFATLQAGNTNHYNQKDLNTFFANLFPVIPPGTHPKEVSIDGAVNASGPPELVGLPECDFDIQASYPVIWPQNSILFEVGDPYYTSTSELYNQYFDGLVDDFLYAIDGSYCNDTSFGLGSNNTWDTPLPDPHSGGYEQKAQCGVYKAPNVLSTSYGDTELNVGTNFLRRQCLEYMKLGMQGVSVISSSGDNGVDCSVDDNRIFAPDFPGTCPYVTTVGSTTLVPGRAIDAPQIATTNFSSGGGFSNIFPRPAYQEQGVENYLNSYPPPFPSYSTLYNQSVGANGGVYNRMGRAFPDLAAVGQNIAGWAGGKYLLANGTSFSAPLFAAMLTRINEVRLQQGKTTVGFINPVLYAHPELFTDVTEGNNTNVGSSNMCNITSPGFSAAPGWDAVTGLGTPKFQAMMDFWTR